MANSQAPAFPIYAEGTFAPTVSLVGGAGNTIPVYTTNTGRHTRIGRLVFVDIRFSGDGGNEGAGTGQVNVALPIAASSNNTAGFRPCGYALNGAVEYVLHGQVDASGTTIYLQYVNLLTTTANFTGADQNNVTRVIRLQFFYEV